MPEITEATVEKIARLANLWLEKDERQCLAKQLEKILEYIDKLNQLDTAGIPQTTHALPLQNVWREDKVIPGLERNEVLAEAPNIVHNGFGIPRIIE